MVIAHKVPSGRDGDQPALEMLDAILSDGKNARLYRALVDPVWRLNAGSGTERHRDLSLHLLYARSHPARPRRRSRKALLAEVDRIQTSGVTQAEVERVKQQYIAADAYRRDGTAGVAANSTSGLRWATGPCT